MSISGLFQYRNDSFQSDIFSSNIRIADVDVRCRISPTLRSMSIPTYAFYQSAIITGKKKQWSSLGAYRPGPEGAFPIRGILNGEVPVLRNQYANILPLQTWAEALVEFTCTLASSRTLSSSCCSTPGHNSTGVRKITSLTGEGHGIEGFTLLIFKHRRGKWSEFGLKIVQDNKDPV